MTIKEKVMMTDYDQVRERACIAYFSANGIPTNMWITRSTFMRLVSGDLEKNEVDAPTTQQKDMFRALKDFVSGKAYAEWFDDQANKIQLTRV